MKVHRTVGSCKPAALKESLSTEHPCNTRSASQCNIRFGDNLRRRFTNSFKQRVAKWYNEVPTGKVAPTLYGKI